MSTRDAERKADAWALFTERVDELGCTNLGDAYDFNYAVHKAMQALRNYLREADR